MRRNKAVVLVLAAGLAVAVPGSGMAWAADTKAPAARITAPAAGATVSGTVSVRADAWDNVGVVKVNLLVDGKFVKSDTARPWAFDWKSAGVADGTHQLQVKAFDGARREGLSTAISVTVRNAPAVRPGVRVSGNKLIRNDKAFAPLGFTMVGLLSPPGCTSGSGVRAREHLNQFEMDTAKAWRANTLRFQVSYRGLTEYTAEERATYLQQIRDGVALARRNGFAVILSLQDQPVGCGPGRPLPAPATPAVWQQLANTFKSDPHVLFQLWNEPDNQPVATRVATTDPGYAWKLAWPDWQHGRSTAIVPAPDAGYHKWSAYVPVGHQALVNAIRATGATNTIVATGSRKGERLEGMPMLKDPLATDNLAYSAHTYYYSDGRAEWDRRFGYLTATKPVIVTEWNFKCGNAKQAAMAAEHLSYLKEKGMGLTAWGLDFMGTLISDWNYTPTSPSSCTTHAGGTAVKAHYASY